MQMQRWERTPPKWRFCCAGRGWGVLRPRRRGGGQFGGVLSQRCICIFWQRQPSHKQLRTILAGLFTSAALPERPCSFSKLDTPAFISVESGFGKIVQWEAINFSNVPGPSGTRSSQAERALPAKPQLLGWLCFGWEQRIFELRCFAGAIPKAFAEGTARLGELYM